MHRADSILQPLIHELVDLRTLQKELRLLPQERKVHKEIRKKQTATLKDLKKTLIPLVQLYDCLDDKDNEMEGPLIDAGIAQVAKRFMRSLRKSPKNLCILVSACWKKDCSEFFSIPDLLSSFVEARLRKLLQESGKASKMDE